MEISYNKGIIIREGNKRIILDPETTKTPIGVPTVITHAHSDHTQGLSGQAYSHLNNITLDLYKASDNRNPKNIVIHNMNEPFELNGFSVELIPAGHLLGASQIVIRSGEQSILYTGDFCPEDLITTKKAKLPENIDVLIMDTTYGNPNLIFHNRQKYRHDLFIWVITQLKNNKLPVINIAKLGNAQEVIAYFNKLLDKMNIFVPPEFHIVNEVYNKYGVNLKYKIIEDDTEIDDKCIVMVQRGVKNINKLTGNNIIRAIVTGQTAKFGFNSFDFAIPLTTHAYNNELLETVNKINPIKVFTNFGYHIEFANFLNNTVKRADYAQSLHKLTTFDMNSINKMAPVYIDKPELSENNSKISSLSEWF